MHGEIVVIDRSFRVFLTSGLAALPCAPYRVKLFNQFPSQRPPLWPNGPQRATPPRYPPKPTSKPPPGGFVTPNPAI